MNSEASAIDHDTLGHEQAPRLADGQSPAGEPQRSWLGAMAVAVEEMVVGTVCVTYDALRGRYDR